MLTLGFITKACHWLARDAAEWSGKTSWKECTCRSALGNRAKGNAYSEGSKGFQEKGGLRYRRRPQRGGRHHFQNGVVNLMVGPKGVTTVSMRSEQVT